MPAPQCAFLFLLFAITAHAQFVLTLPDGTAAPPVYDLGRFYIGDVAAAHFRLRNSSSAGQTLTSLGIAGVGFTLDAPSVPVGIPALGAIDLTVIFRAGETGTYSAAFHADGVGILITASVLPSLTWRLDGGLLLAVDFGSVVRGAIVQRTITLRNETPVVLIVPAISVEGSGFSLAAPLPSGQTLQPQQGGELIVIFNPPANGARQGQLTIGDRSYPLLGMGVDPPMPTASLAINLKPAASAQQGTLLIRFDAAAQTSGNGTVTLDFRGQADPAIAFAAGGRSASFAVVPGDTQALLPFQTGTTAGTLTFTVRLGQATVEQSVDIAAAQPAITASQGIRATSSIEIRVTGYDNTRTLGALAFTFLDAGGRAVSTIRTDAGGDFAGFFATSDLGGVFLLRAVFPVTGDASQVAGCDVSLTNAAGTSTVRVAVP